MPDRSLALETPPIPSIGSPSNQKGPPALRTHKDEILHKRYRRKSSSLPYANWYAIALSVLAGSMARLGAQLALTAVGVIVLPLEDFGRFAALVALSRFVAPAIESGARILFYQSGDFLAGAEREHFWWSLLAGRLLVACGATCAMGVVGATTLDMPIHVALAIASSSIPLVALTVARARYIDSKSSKALTVLELARSLAVALPAVSIFAGTSSLDSWSLLVFVGNAIFTAGLVGHFWNENALAALANWKAYFDRIGAGLAISLGLLAQAGSMVIDQFLLGLFGFHESAALYSLAASSVALGIAPITAANEVLLSKLTRRRNGPLTFNRRYSISIALAMGVLAAAAWPSWIYLGFIVPGERRDLLASLSVLLLVIITPRVILVPVTLKLHRAGRHMDRARIDTAALAINLGLNLALIPRLDIWAPPIAMAISELFFCIASVKVHRRCRPTGREHGANAAI